MPNEEVIFFKPSVKINEKIIYVKDSELLGFESANIFAFTFNLQKLENFGITKNFIYMEDDFFIGKRLKKRDFFYYDIRLKKVIPYIVTSHFDEINKTKVLNNYYNLFKIKEKFHPHSGEGWSLSLLCTEKYLIEQINSSLITTQYTHNAMPQNIDELKEIYEKIKKYKYINQTIYSKERFILTLNQPHFYNLYELNIKNSRVHSIPYKYIPIESINKAILDKPLFVINTGGNHRPLDRHYKLAKKIIEKKYDNLNIFEINIKTMQKIIINIYYIFIIFCFLKIILLLN
jgi:hypothetical protein